MKSLNTFLNHFFWGIILVISATSMPLSAQNTSSVKGAVFEAISSEPVPFATISLTNLSDTLMRFMKGTISDEKGNFTISQVQNGKYTLQISFVGYQKVKRIIEIEESKEIDAGVFYLQDSSFSIAETLIVADKLKGKSETGKTTYYINTKLLSATGNSPDLLRHIPGVQVDVKQNISLGGNPNILIFVDGKERDKSFIGQLNPALIDRIEVSNTPPSNYDGNVSGVINIVLKKEKTKGVSGHFFSEIPTTESIVYLFPAYSLNYNFDKINLYTSYNGEINYENIDEIMNRRIFNDPVNTSISTVENVRQKNLSGKFHYGMDYQITKKDVVNFYGYYNRFSYEQDGKVVAKSTAQTAADREAQKEETDDNRHVFNSLYYKHLIGDKGAEIAIDLSNSFSFSDNNVTYNNISLDGGQIHTNSQNPEQIASSLKIDFSTPLSEKINLSTGAKYKIHDMQDKVSDGFSYTEQTSAFYGAIIYKRARFDSNIGVRIENSETEVNSTQSKSLNTFLPYAAIHYKLNDNNNLYLSFRSSIQRPSVYLLNQFSYATDPYTIIKGNPWLQPALNNQIQLEHTISFNSNYVSARLFYETITNALHNLTQLTDSNIFISQVQNCGSLSQFGVQISGVFKLGMLTISSSFRVYNQSATANSLAKQYGIENKNNLVFETGISTILSFKHDFALSAILQHETKKVNIQDNISDDMLYFISLDKTFKKNLKIGVVSALPFAKRFIYQKSEIHNPDFSSTYTGILKLPAFPLMFRVSYQFGKGLKSANLSRDKENVDTRPKQGF